VWLTLQANRDLAEAERARALTIRGGVMAAV
jgi:plasmid maintenance system antidote protein VapI